jgi:CheY-like chemotaxis protein
MPAATVLIVDDDAAHMDIATTILRHHGYQTLSAVDADQAMLLIMERRPQAVIMDVRLPRVDGWMMTRQIKDDARTASIPIIIFTASALPEDRERSAEAGAFCHLAKPCEPREIVEAVERCLSLA